MKIFREKSSNVIVAIGDQYSVENASTNDDNITVCAVRDAGGNTVYSGAVVVEEFELADVSAVILLSTKFIDGSLVQEGEEGYYQ